jgi:hypothetical protein
MVNLTPIELEVLCDLEEQAVDRTLAPVSADNLVRYVP